MRTSNAEAVDTLRRFSRLFTAKIGVLDEDFLGRDRPLGESRTLFEIGRGTAAVTDLRDRLGLDSGYLSRLLRQLESAGLVVTSADPEDGRRRLVSLTAAGQAEWTVLDGLSNRRIEGLMEPLGARQAARLVALVAEGHDLIAAATATFTRAPSSDPEAIRAMSAYFDEIDRVFPDGFDPGDWRAESAAAFDGENGAFVLLHLADRVVGCGGWQTIDTGVGEIKRMWLDPAARGLGLGRRLLADLEDRVAEHGHRAVRLDTNENLGPAIAMYEAAGYRRVPRYNDNPYATHFFEKHLV
ncbi:MarR family winged helix-turn-helix transcriptional regulator [Euzebya tangerina]|uniref:MarR family winged helix-turn-helix transcriptional regulator n=1 Tax=Euzebya tangerina TaxID=591198 RepID=UPI000E31FB20|nr:MarR family winged helix-turn-helix transcriptional regulator [Euzebya tangerina]